MGTSDEIQTLAEHVRDLVLQAAEATAKATIRAEELVRECSEIMEEDGSSVMYSTVLQYADGLAKNLRGKAHSGIAFNAASEDAEAAAEIAKLAAQRSAV
jgi:hypothetical protein